MLRKAELESIGLDFKGAQKQSLCAERYAMSMHPHPVPPIPEETVRVAHAAFPRGNFYLTLRDKLGTLYQDAVNQLIRPGNLP